MSPTMREALITFQRKEGFEASGRIDTRTVTALGLEGKVKVKSESSTSSSSSQSSSTTSQSSSGAQKWSRKARPVRRRPRRKTRLHRRRRKTRHRKRGRPSRRARATPRRLRQLRKTSGAALPAAPPPVRAAARRAPARDERSENRSVAAFGRERAKRKASPVK